jgi:hypothetical protein
MAGIAGKHGKARPIIEMVVGRSRMAVRTLPGPSAMTNRANPVPATSAAAKPPPAHGGRGAADRRQISDQTDHQSGSPFLESPTASMIHRFAHQGDGSPGGQDDDDDLAQGVEAAEIDQDDVDNIAAVGDKIAVCLEKIGEAAIQRCLADPGEQGGKKQPDADRQQGIDAAAPRLTSFLPVRSAAVAAGRWRQR